MAMLRSTGTPAELAEKLDVSARTVKRIIKELREEGALLRFDHYGRSYKLEEND